MNGKKNELFVFALPRYVSVLDKDGKELERMSDIPSNIKFISYIGVPGDESILLSDSNDEKISGLKLLTENDKISLSSDIFLRDIIGYPKGSYGLIIEPGNMIRIVGGTRYQKKEKGSKEYLTQKASHDVFEIKNDNRMWKVENFLIESALSEFFAKKENKNSIIFLPESNGDMKAYFNHPFTNFERDSDKFIVFYIASPNGVAALAKNSDTLGYRDVFDHGNGIYDLYFRKQDGDWVYVDENVDKPSLGDDGKFYYSKGKRKDAFEIYEIDDGKINKIMETPRDRGQKMVNDYIPHIFRVDEKRAEKIMKSLKNYFEKKYNL